MQGLTGLGLCYYSTVYLLCFEHPVNIIDSEQSKVGYTLLYTPPLPRCY